MGRVSSKHTAAWLAAAALALAAPKAALAAKATNLERLAAAARLHPANPLAARRHAEALREAGWIVDAEHEIERAVQLEPHPMAFLARCRVRLDLKKYADAATDCETAHGADPSESSTYWTARAYLATGRPDAAVTLLKAAHGGYMRSKRNARLLVQIRSRAVQKPAANASRR
jgi:tetratricopeptide (TPR) repeat protein